MSCLAGIGAQRPGFVAKLRSSEVWIIDGCAIECARGVFEQAGRAGAITHHIRLHDLVIKKHHGSNGGIDLDSLASQTILSQTTDRKVMAPRLSVATDPPCEEVPTSKISTIKCAAAITAANRGAQ